jgi:hypothetical protein
MQARSLMELFKVALETAGDCHIEQARGLL